jgi:hypothetical protein
MALHVSRFTIDSWMGVEHLEIDCKEINRVKGDNGTGKTSVIRALSSMLNGGRDPKAIRHGSKSAEVSLQLSNGKTFIQVETEKGVYLYTLDENGRRIPARREDLRNMLDSFAVNAAKFESAKPDERLRLFLEAMPLTVTEEQLAAACGDCMVVPPGGASGHALDVIDKTYGRLEEIRRGVNSDHRSKKAHSEELEKTLPAEGGAKLNERRSEVRREKEALERSMQEANDTCRETISAAERNFAVACEEAVAAATEESNDAIRQYESLIAEVKAGIAAKRSSLERERDAGIAEIREKAQSELLASAQGAGQKRSTLAAEEATLNAQIDEHQRAAGTRDLLARLKPEIVSLSRQSEAQTSALKRLTELRRTLTAKLPIPGLEPRDGDLYYKGVDWDHLNTATWVTLFVGLCTLRAPKGGGFIVLDGAECLGQAKQQGLEEYCKKKGIQIIYAAVAEGPLRVEVE